MTLNTATKAEAKRAKTKARAAAKAKAKRARRPKYTAEAPLEIVVELPAIEAVAPPRWRAAIGRPLLAFVDSLPEVTNSAAGRGRANVTRSVMGLTALFCISLARQAGAFFAVLGVLVAVSLVFVPASALRKARWRHSLTRLMGGGERRVLAAGALKFDGTRVEVRDANGRIWSSGRPMVKPHVVLCGERHGDRWLGIIQPTGKKRTAAWFQAPQRESKTTDGDNLPQWPGAGVPLERALGQHVNWGFEGKVEAAHLSADAFDTLLAAIGPAPGKSKT